MRSFLAALIATTVVQATALADTWCNSVKEAIPSTIFCDDFDRYCQSPPVDPTMPCPISGSSKHDPSMRHVWIQTSTRTAGGGEACGAQLTIEEPSGTPPKQKFGTSDPYGARDPNGGDEGGQLGQKTVDLVNGIKAQFGSQYTTVAGTDANPLTVRYDASAGIQTNVASSYDNGYMELGLDDNLGAPTDWVMVGDDVGPDAEGCFSCYNMCPGPNYGPHVAWPTICQSYSPRAVSPACPTNLLTNVRPALAVGFLSMLDNNPCHCENPADQVPQNYHLSYYDGLKWRILNSGMFPPAPDGGTEDFSWGNKINNIVMTVRTNDVYIYFSYKEAGTGIMHHSSAIIPRLYTGAFNKLRGGVAAGKRLEPDVSIYHAMPGDANIKCIRMGDTRCDGGGWQDNKANYVIYDGVLVFGGQPDVQTGACCLNNGTCQDLFQTDCTTLGGTFNGVNTLCSSTTCCHVPYADTDSDSDVDMDDFAEFQKCYTGTQPGVSGACTCFDKNDDNKIDVLDFTSFTNCVSGAKVPWSLANSPACVP